MSRTESLGVLTGNAPAGQTHLGRRVGGMALLWVGFAFTIGPCTAPPEHGVVGLISGAIAGLILLVPFGILLGLLGGGWKETLAGAVGGLVVGVPAALLSGSAPLRVAVSTGLLSGAMVGATFPALLRQARGTFLALASLLPARPPRAVVVR